MSRAHPHESAGAIADESNADDVITIPEALADLGDEFEIVPIDEAHARELISQGDGLIAAGDGISIWHLPVDDRERKER